MESRCDVLDIRRDFYRKLAKPGYPADPPMDLWIIPGTLPDSDPILYLAPSGW